MHLNANTKIEIVSYFSFLRPPGGYARPMGDIQDRQIKTMDKKPTTLSSETSVGSSKERAPVPGWIKVAAIAAASALAGGFAATWFHRKAVSRLQNAVEQTENSNFHIS